MYPGGKSLLNNFYFLPYSKIVCGKAMVLCGALSKDGSESWLYQSPFFCQIDDMKLSMYNSWVFSLPSMSDIVHVSGQFQDFYINGSFILEKEYRRGRGSGTLLFVLSGDGRHKGVQVVTQGFTIRQVRKGYKHGFLFWKAFYFFGLFFQSKCFKRHSSVFGCFFFWTKLCGFTKVCILDGSFGFFQASGREERIFGLRNISSKWQLFHFKKRERVLMDVSLLSSDMRKFSHDTSFPFYPKSSFLPRRGQTFFFKIAFSPNKNI